MEPNRPDRPDTTETTEQTKQSRTLFKDVNGGVSSKRVMAFSLAPCALAITILCIYEDPNSAGVIIPAIWGSVVGLLGVTVLEKKNGR